MMSSRKGPGNKGRGDKGRGDAKRVVQQQLAKEKRRQRTLLTSAIAVAVLVIAGLISWAVMAGQQHDTVTTPTVAVDDGTGFAVGSGPVKIDIYEDFICPACGDFEKSAGSTVSQLVTDGKVTVVYHPIAILDRYSSTEYSTRAAAASAAAAQGGKFAEFHNALFAQQPEENSAGLSDAELVEIGKSVGLSDAAFANAVTDGTYRGWAAKVTETASARGVTGTPTVLVAGKQIDQPTPQALTAAVAAAAA
jgi:protein-disulfide isomerase